MTRVFIVAASAVVRAGLEALLQRAGLDVVGSAARTPEAADVVLADLEGANVPLPATSGALVLLADETDPLDLVLRTGARSVLPRSAGEDEIAAAVAGAAAGLVVLPPGALEPGRLLAPRIQTEGEALTAREIEVLGMLAEGMGNKQIAHEMGISEHTVKFHVGSILGKLGAASRTEAVTLGVRQGLIML